VALKCLPELEAAARKIKLIVSGASSSLDDRRQER